jgi:RimJ/RimL family protein N-acetyltransferase
MPLAPLNLDNVPAAVPTISALAECLPNFETERLLLRAPQLSDWTILEPIWTTDQGRFIGGPMSQGDAWLDFNQLIACWMLRGFGPLTVVRKSDQEILGLIILEHENGDPEPELGWLFTKEAEGHGYAFEAAKVLLNEATNIFGSGKFVSYVEAGNDRSVRLAERLGARKDKAPHPDSRNVWVFRHGEAIQ